MPGNTSDKTTLSDFLEKIEAQYGRSDRVWIMDRGIPTEETLAAMRDGEAPVHYLVGTPKGRLTRLEKAFVGLALASGARVGRGEAPDRGRRTLHPGPEPCADSEGARHAPARLKKLWQRLHELRGQSLKRDELLLKLGAAKKEAGRAWHLSRSTCPRPARPSLRRPSPSHCGATGCAAPGAARAAICCAPI